MKGTFKVQFLDTFSPSVNPSISFPYIMESRYWLVAGEEKEGKKNSQPGLVRMSANITCVKYKYRRIRSLKNPSDGTKSWNQPVRLHQCERTGIMWAINSILPQTGSSSFTSLLFQWVCFTKVRGRGSSMEEAETATVQVVVKHRCPLVAGGGNDTQSPTSELHHRWQKTRRCSSHTVQL